MCERKTKSSISCGTLGRIFEPARRLLKVKSMAPVFLLLVLPIGSLCRYASGQTPSGEQRKVESPREVSFPTDDGGRIFAILSGSGEHAVVLAHGAAFNKESWAELSELL